MDCFRAAKVVNTLDLRVVKYGIFFAALIAGIAHIRNLTRIKLSLALLMKHVTAIID